MGAAVMLSNCLLLETVLVSGSCCISESAKKKFVTVKTRDKRRQCDQKLDMGMLKIPRGM